MVMVLLLIAVVPLMDKVVKPVTVSATPSPNTALPLMVSALALPVNVLRVVMVLPAKVVAAPRVSASP